MNQIYLICVKLTNEKEVTVLCVRFLLLENKNVRELVRCH